MSIQTRRAPTRVPTRTFRSPSITKASFVTVGCNPLYHKVEDSSVGSTPRTAQHDSTHPRWQRGTRDDTR